jgi:hypothetical protein
LTIEIEKYLIEGNSVIATITPKKAEEGKWLFTGEARC